MKTLLITDNFPPRTGGSGRWFWEMYSRLPRASYAIAAGEHPRQHDFDEGHDLRVFRLPLTLRKWGVLSRDGLQGYLRAIRGLRRVIASERISMVHCGRCLPEGVMALAVKMMSGIPYSCYVHGEDVTTAADSREYSWLVRRVLYQARYVIANSHNTARILGEDWGVSAARIVVLHPGVDTQRFIPSKRDSRIRNALGWHDRRVLLTVGRLQLRKGHDRMILALRTIRETVPDVLYAIAGDGEERTALEDLVARQGLGDHVQFLGEVGDDRLVQCYQQCDLFVLPNRQVGRDIEGFGMVLLEAQACGKPVIAGASGGTAETMQPGETGYVVPCDEPGDLAAIVAELLLDPDRRTRMGESARSWVVERFDWDVLSTEAADLFEKETIGPLLKTVAT